MRNFINIITEAEIEPIIDQAKLAKAAADGFDTDRLWFHGTPKAFNKFRLPKTNGINELGQGVYVTSYRGVANAWAQGGGHILACVVRRGPVIELSEIPTAQLWGSSPEHDERWANRFWRQAYLGYAERMEKDYGMPGETAAMPWRDWAEKVNKGDISIKDCFETLGYIGLTSRYSQIRGQMVVWDPANIRVVGRAPGVSGWVPDED